MTNLPLNKTTQIEVKYSSTADAVLLLGDSNSSLKTIPSESVQLIITSPPYNIGKSYETAAQLSDYLDALQPIIEELFRVLQPGGSICWQVGNFVEDGEVFPLDIYFYPIFKKLGLNLRNRIVWHFEHGLHATKRFSGRYETLLWFTKGDTYKFNLDPIRVPSKYPGKTHYKGAKYGQPSGNPLGKNPSDFWKILEREWESSIWAIPNVKANHPEKTIHPCQFPIELVERCVLAMTDRGDTVLDPFLGAGSTVLAAIRHERKSIGCEKEEKYIQIARERIEQFDNGLLPYRPLGKPIFQPTGREKISQIPQQWQSGSEK